MASSDLTYAKCYIDAVVIDFDQPEPLYQLREKGTGRLVEFVSDDPAHLQLFLSKAIEFDERFGRTLLTSGDDLRDYLVVGGTAVVDDSDRLLFADDHQQHYTFAFIPEADLMESMARESTGGTGDTL